jgi:hypothetical protein
MLVIVKSRVIQRAMAAEYADDTKSARKYFLAAGHLELLLADDYRQAGDARLAFRSALSAGSCFWSGGNADEGREIFDALRHQYPAWIAQIDDAQQELEQGYAKRRPTRQSRAKRVETRRAKRAKPRS